MRLVEVMMTLQQLLLLRLTQRWLLRAAELAVPGGGQGDRLQQRLSRQQQRPLVVAASGEPRAKLSGSREAGQAAQESCCDAWRLFDVG
jgi:hypothetical protein